MHASRSRRLRVCVSWQCSHTLVVFVHTHTEWSSQLIEECRDGCQILLQHYRSLLCGYEDFFFLPIIHSECVRVSLNVCRTVSSRTEIGLLYVAAL